MRRYRADPLYHATPSRNVSSIRAHGIRLSSGARGQAFETPRIYLTDDTNMTYAFAAQLFAEEPDIGEVSVLEVDPRQVAGLHDDPDWCDDTHLDYVPVIGYTEEAIPASAVGRVVEVYTRDDFDD